MADFDAMKKALDNAVETEIPECANCGRQCTKKRIEVTTFGSDEPTFLEVDGWECRRCDTEALYETIQRLRTELADALELAEAYKSACEYLQAGVPSGNQIASGAKVVVSTSWDGERRILGIQENA